MIKMDGEFKQGSRYDKEEAFLVFPGDMIGYTIDYISDEECHFEKIIVWEDESLRNLIVELLNKHYEEIHAKK